MTQQSWMWHDDNTNGVRGASINFKSSLVRWYDQPGCACAAGGEGEQTIEEFLSKGGMMHPPADVLEEMHAAIKAHRQQV